MRVGSTGDSSLRRAIRRALATGVSVSANVALQLAKYRMEGRAAIIIAPPRAACVDSGLAEQAGKHQ